MFIIEVLKALMRRLLSAGKRMIKALPDEIRDGNKNLLITMEGWTVRAKPRLTQSLPRPVLPSLALPAPSLSPAQVTSEEWVG